MSTGSRDYSPGSLTGAKQGIVVLTDLTSSWGLEKMAPQRRARARTHRPETPVVWPFNGTDTSTLPCRSPHIYHGQLCAAGQVLVCSCSPVYDGQGHGGWPNPNPGHGHHHTHTNVFHMVNRYMYFGSEFQRVVARGWVPVRIPPTVTPATDQH